MPSSRDATAIQTLRWQIANDQPIVPNASHRAPVLASADVQRIGAGLDIWDAWPLADATGQPVLWRGGELWFALAAPVSQDPEQRHFAARIHHFHRRTDGFHHLGPTLPAALSPGSREWSGAARLEGDTVKVCFTAAGVKNEGEASYRQRLFYTQTRLSSDPTTVFEKWSKPKELLAPGGLYLDADEAEGRIGEIKAFRDPFLWRGTGGRDFLLFTGSSAINRGAFNGVIGLAEAGADGQLRALPPLIDASGVNNELERPHIVTHEGRLYLFWSTQAKVFAPGIAAPTGLYGASALDIGGPWELLNGHGLVFANPEREPFQCYSWWVLPDLSVASFVDYWGIDHPNAAAKPTGRTHFGGTFAPFLQIALDRCQATLISAARS